ncbi:ATP-binding cassette domain-containing protein, partial [Turicibacter sanguinis]|nr:ATP-binding cassette domain-containing protein [Turicibacter sanguinis]
ISVKNVSKSYNMYNKPEDRLKEMFSIRKKVYHEKFWALKEISFDVPKGRTVGIVGKNGSGKSTLLQIICGTLQNTEGEVNVQGRISALLELGTGFNPEFSGRENVYMYCSLMGLSEEETEAVLPNIEDFAEIGEFIDQPVKTYSSGMYVRLAFAAAVNVEPDILIVDEALAVGDMYFQLKCINKIKEFKEMGKTIFFVTHDTYTVKNICDYAIWINNGKVEMQGDVGVVVDEFEKFMKRMSGLTTDILNSEIPEVGEKEVLRITNVTPSNLNNENKSTFKLGEDIVVNIEYEVYKEIDGITGGVALFDSTGHYLCGLNTKLDDIKINHQIGTHLLQLTYSNIQLLPGTYFLDVGFFEDTAIARLDYKAKCSNFVIVSDKYLAEGNVLLKHNWSC